MGTMFLHGTVLLETITTTNSRLNMTIEELIKHHKQELLTLKSQMYEAEQRIKELAVILASLERAKDLSANDNH
jgi:hypothetical protein